MRIEAQQIENTLKKLDVVERVVSLMERAGHSPEEIQQRVRRLFGREVRAIEAFTSEYVDGPPMLLDGDDVISDQ